VGTGGRVAAGGGLIGSVRGVAPELCVEIGVMGWGLDAALRRIAWDAQPLIDRLPQLRRPIQPVVSPVTLMERPNRSSTPTTRASAAAARPAKARPAP
jgi:hypothetical protein